MCFDDSTYFPSRDSLSVFQYQLLFQLNRFSGSCGGSMLCVHVTGVAQRAQRAEEVRMVDLPRPRLVAAGHVPGLKDVDPALLQANLQIVRQVTFGLLQME